MNGTRNQRASRLGSAWAGLMAILLLGSTLVGLGAATADANDGKPKYTVTAEGITLPAGYAFEAHGHVNWKTSWAQHGVHFDPNNNQPGGAYIGKTFLPWNLEPGECVTWVQVAGWNYHFGEGGESPICAPKTEEPPVDPPKPEQPAPLVREKTTDVCKAASRVTDFYETPYVWSPEKKAWVLGKETWVRKTSTPLTAAECGYQTVVREKVTVDCKGGAKNVVFTDFYIREWTFDSKTKSWVLGPEKWSHKVKVPATDTQCPPPVEPTPEPTTPEPTPDPTPDPTDEPTDPPVTEEPTEEPTEPPVTPEPTDPPTSPEPTQEPTEPPVEPEPTEEPSEPTPTTEPTTPVPSEEPTWNPTTPSTSPSAPVSPSTPTSPPAASTTPAALTPALSSSSPRPSQPSAAQTPKQDSRSLASTGSSSTGPLLAASLVLLGALVLSSLAVLRRRGN